MALGRKTGGRQKGTPNRKTRTLLAQVEASGMSPLDFLLQVMRDPAAPLATRFEAAYRAAPYVHPRLAAVEHAGKDKGQIETKVLSDLDAARRIAFIFDRATRKPAEPAPATLR